MNIVTILGSPRLRGNTAAILEYFEDKAKAQGHQIDRIDLVKHKLKGCFGCEKCRSNLTEPACVVKDGMVELFDRIISADLVIYASPLYVYGFTSQMKQLLDRQYCLAKFTDAGDQISLVKDKPMALLVTCEGPIQDNADLITTIFQRECDFIQTQMKGSFIIPDIESREDALNKADSTTQTMIEALL